jgi:hypothetical protein
MANNLRDLMKELEFELIVEGTPTMWTRHAGDEEIQVGQMSDGEIHVTRTSEGQLPIVVRLNRFDEGLAAMLRDWLLVNA